MRENLVLTYDRFGEPTEVHLTGVGRFTQFPDVGSDDKDLSLTLGLTHNFSTRLSFSADVYAAYQTEPNFQSNVGPENVRAPHFDTHSIFSLSYHWLPRLSSITSFTFERIDYFADDTADDSDDRRTKSTGPVPVYAWGRTAI